MRRAVVGTVAREYVRGPLFRAGLGGGLAMVVEVLMVVVIFAIVSFS
jgi:hypothetical protein